MVAVLSDAEFAALSYGCFLEVVTGATASPSDFDSYDEVYDTLTKDVKSVYLYHGVDDVLLEDDTVIGFTETATRHMATTGEMEFYEKETGAEQSWEDGKNASIIIASVGMGLIGITKITPGPGQVRDVNSPMLEAMLTCFGVQVINYGIVIDNEALLSGKVTRAVAECDAVLYLQIKLKILKTLLIRNLAMEIHLMFIVMD